ncbi:hypothetical protein [Paraflavitalea soli]|uniref:hypothetical protein n=1 Tax=Paraflavitalea soli TaxID=2315862 RepID=UPI0013C501E9|nr:hypothetical protein [Paraflavitalea soli]
MKATIIDSEVPNTCKERLIKKLLTIKGWQPAQNKGKPVCSIYRWYIACMRWVVE